MDVVTSTRSRRLPLIDGVRAMRTWLVVSLLCNMGIIVTGAVVRVTGSGLGCSTWPQCHEGSYVPHGEAGIHSYIEFGNRLLTFVLALAALGAFIAVWRNLGRGSKLWWLTLGIGLGIPLQGVIGGITVLAKLNPWVVSLHLVLSVALVVLCVWSVQLGFGVTPEPVGRIGRILAITTFSVSMLAIWLGTVATGAGPHAGDATAVRNGLDIVSVTRAHSLTAWTSLLLTVACVVVFARGAGLLARRAAAILLASLLFQAAVGYIQYFMGLPMFVVVLHLVGVALVNATAAWLLFATTSNPAGADAGTATRAARTSS